MTAHKFTGQGTAVQFVRDTFTARQQGRAFWGRIVIKDRFYGMTTGNDTVRVYSNRGEQLYITNGAYGDTVTETSPEMAWTA